MTLPAVPDDKPVGLEDFGMGDVSMPRIDIVHSDGVFRHSLSGETFTELNCIVLGVVRQRILWPADLPDEPEAPLCKSLDFHVGIPGPKFPYEATAFTLESVTENGGKVACEMCPLHKWGSHPKGKRPWCGEMWNFAILIIDEDGAFSPAIWTVKSSSLTAAKAYLSSFVVKKKATFTQVTKVTLNMQKKGSNRYSVATFAAGAKTELDMHERFVDQMQDVRNFLQSERASEETEEVVIDTSTLSDDTPLEDF